LIFKVFERCFKPIGWDGDIRKLRNWLMNALGGYSFVRVIGSKPTVWDGDTPGLPSRMDPFFFVPSPLCGIATGTLIFATL